jgi:archaellum biogenesis protein FlaJ (TadC family)
MKFEPWATAYNILNKKLEKVYPHFQDLHIQLKKGGVLVAFKAYIAFMVLVSIIAFLVTITLSFILLPLLSGIAYLSAPNFLFSLVLGTSAAMVALITMYIYPGMKASNRNGPIDKNLPYISNFLTLLSSSNVPPSIIFESMAKIDTLREVRLRSTISYETSKSLVKTS